MWVMNMTSPESLELDTTENTCLTQPSVFWGFCVIALQETSLMIQFQKLNCIFYLRYCMIGMMTSAGNCWQKSTRLAKVVGTSSWRTERLLPVSNMKHTYLSAVSFLSQPCAAEPNRAWCKFSLSNRVSDSFSTGTPLSMNLSVRIGDLGYCLDKS